MIKFENTEVLGFEPAIRGMRNPKSSWDRIDSGYCETHGPDHCIDCPHVNNCDYSDCDILNKYIVGPNDFKRMKGLVKAGTDHRKFMRMITVYVDITASLYWWKEFDTYKVGTVSNSCSTMHKLADKEFTLDDFSHEHLFGDKEVAECSKQGIDIDACDALACTNVDGDPCYFSPEMFLQMICDMLNFFRKLYLETEDKKYWWQMIQLLPSSYMQKRTIMMNYEVLANIYKSRKDHKLDEWKEHEDETYYGLCDWIKSLPYSELITGNF